MFYKYSIMSIYVNVCLECLIFFLMGHMIKNVDRPLPEGSEQ